MDGSTRLRLPHLSIVRRYAARGFVLWVLARLMMMAVAIFGALIPLREVVRWSASGAIGMLGVCAVLGFVDVRVRRERTLLGNLGIDDREVVVMYIAAAVVGELLLAMVMPW